MLDSIVLSVSFQHTVVAREKERSEPLYCGKGWLRMIWGKKSDLNVIDEHINVLPRFLLSSQLN